MSQLESLNRAMAYIDYRIGEEINMAELARIAECSQYQLQRMFPYLTGITLSDYLKRRAMTKAAEELVSTNAKVIDVALKYGYDSPTSFARAFKRVHDITPSQACRNDTKIRLYPRLVFTLSVKGEEAMDYKIIEQPAFRVVSIPSNNGDWDLQDAGSKATEYWDKLGADIHAVLDLMDGSQPEGLLGIQFCKDGKFDCYMACVATNQPCPDGMEKRIVEAATYAVFECVEPMPDAMTDLWHRILTGRETGSGDLSHFAILAQVRHRSRARHQR